MFILHILQHHLDRTVLEDEGEEQPQTTEPNPLLREGIHGPYVVMLDELKTLLHQGHVQHLKKFFMLLRLKVGGQIGEPWSEKYLPPNLLWFQVHHPTSTDGGW